jgi:hypothetical protein
MPLHKPIISFSLQWNIFSVFHWWIAGLLSSKFCQYTNLRKRLSKCHVKRENKQKVQDFIYKYRIYFHLAVWKLSFFIQFDENKSSIYRKKNLNILYLVMEILHISYKKVNEYEYTMLIHKELLFVYVYHMTDIYCNNQKES